MADKLLQQRQACSDMMEEVTDMLNANFSGKELNNCKNLMAQLAEKVAENEFNVKQTIKDLTTQITETELQTQHDAETHQKKMQALAEEKEASSAALQECTASHTQNREILADTRRKIVVADGRLRDIETNQTAVVTELKHYISLYLSISNMVFDYDNTNNSLAGYTANAKNKNVKAFEWANHHDEFETANALWDFVAAN